MKDFLTEQAKKYLKDHRKRKTLAVILCCLSMLTFFGVNYALLRPAVSMEHRSMTMTASPCDAAMGETLQVTVNAVAQNGKKLSSFLMRLDSTGAGLSDEYDFDNNDTAVISTENGDSLKLHRFSDGAGHTDYYFSLQKGEAVSFTLDCISGAENQNLQATSADAVSEPAEENAFGMKEQSDLIREELGEILATSSDLTEAAVSSGTSTSSNAAAKLSETAIASETEEEDCPLPDGPVLNGPVQSGTDVKTGNPAGQSVQISTASDAEEKITEQTVTFWYGSGENLQEAWQNICRDAVDAASASEASRSDAEKNCRLVLSWYVRLKDLLETRTLQAKIYTDAAFTELSGDTTVITVNGLLPKDACVRAYPVNNATPSDTTKVVFAYDVGIYHADGSEYEPGNEKIKVQFSKPGLAKESGLEVYHQSNGSSTSEKLDSTLDANDDAITFSTDHFSLFKILASGSEYTITIDPLNGMGSGVYYGAALNNYGGYNTASCTIKVWSGNSFSLPTKDQVTVPQRYIRNGQKNYYLRGWYCVTNANQSGTQKYFQPGATVTNVEGNMMFYADWAVVNYTPSSHSGSLSDGTGTGVSLDTSNFVNINMFDYNDLVNTFSAHPFSDTITDSWGMNKPAEADQGLVFINSKASNCSIAQMKYSNAGDRYLGVNTSRWTSSYRLPGYQYIGTITPGVLTSNAGGLDSSLNAAGWLYKLFNPSTSSAADINSGGDVAGRTYVGTSNYLFQRDKQGYYYYDSTKNAAEYDQTAGRFYLKDGPDMISKSATNSSKSGDYSDFVPYNNWGDASGTTNNTIPTFNELGETNYWFGMRTDIHFYLPNDSRSDGKANLVTDTADSSNLLPTTFEFSGDDDVWVFVDGHLVLDLGGIHDVVGGTINFSDGTIKTYDTLVSDSGGVSEQTLPYSLSDYLSGHIVGEHTLTMFYMERGASESNCYIKFNMRPRYKLQLNKLDADTKAVLKDATFAFYDDQDCTIPSSLWKSQNEENSGADAANEFSTDSSGKLNCWGLLTLHPYYIQEKVAPPGYPAVTKKICLYLDAYGSPTVKVYDSSGNELSTNNFVTACSLDDTKTVVITAQNKKRETTSISVQKSWKDVSGNPITDLKEGKVSASLYRSTKSLGSLTGNTKGNYTVSFATNYFGTSNGSNSDMSAVSAGDLTPSSFSAASGSTVTIEVGTDDPTQLGIYSVTANGEVLTPSDHSKVTYSTEWCLIGKKWQCPPSHATYVIDKIAADTKIVVTFIGYLNYPAGSGTASLAASATISGSYTGGGGAASATEGDMIKAQASLVEKVSLTADSGWKYSWSNLPKKDEDGNLYYYYVVEDPLITGYDVTYPAEGLSDSGSVLKIENKVHSFSLNLVKKGTDGAQEVPLSGVEFSLYQANVAGGTWTASGNIYQTAVSDAGGNVKFAGLSKGNYILKETKAATGYQLPSEPWKITITDTGKVTVTDQNGKGTEGESTVSFVLLNTKVYVLPKTGGSGSLLYTMLGILLMITAGVMYGKRYIMDERRQKTG